MAIDNAGVGDEATVDAPGWREKAREEYVQGRPPCAKCGSKLEPVGKNMMRVEPKMRCSNVSCINRHKAQ